jgi:hypothetical protein
MNRTWSLRSAVVAWLIAGTWAMWPRETLSHNPITTTVHFNREIVALLQRRCLQCHREGGMAMSLATYAEARPWAVAIKEEVLARQMPPDADPTLRHYLQKKSYEKARLFLQGRDAENRAGSCRHV